MIYELPFFAAIDTQNLDKEYRAEIDFAGNKILLDINFTASSISSEGLDFIKIQIENLVELDAQNRKEIEEETKDGFVVKDYIDDAMDMMEKEDIKNVMKRVDLSKPKKRQIFDALYLNRVGFYPEEQELCVICDYTFDEIILDELLVVSRSKDGSFINIGIES